MNEQEVIERFAADVKDHRMTVLRDDGLYRHVRFIRWAPPREGGDPRPTSFYWFDLITWPGCLAISGDMGGFMFARIDDMFDFFRGQRINPQYWAEKIRAGGPSREFSEDRFKQVVIEEFTDAVKAGDAPRGLGKALRTEILGDPEIHYEDGARRALAEFEYYRNEKDRYSPKRPDFRFVPDWEWDFSDWSYRYLWCCHAIQWGIRQYTEQKAQQAAPEAVSA